jgi:alkylhydroperoxidase family enzyme
MRVPPPDRTSLAPETDELLALATAPSGETAETIAVLAHSPALVAPFLGWAMALHTQGVLSKRLHEIVALRVAHNCGSAYEWDEHVGWAHDAGLTDAEIGSVRAGADGWSRPEATVIHAVDELHAAQDLTERTLASLRDDFGDAAVVEIIVVAGQYTMLSMLATVTGPVERRPTADGG